MSDTILTETRGAVAVITLNRPHVLNAWDAPMRMRLIEVLKELEADMAIRALVLTGAGERAFGAGQDLNETRTFSPERARDWMGEWEDLYDAIRGLSKPLIAALNGVAAGSAFQVALLADIRIAHAGVRLGQPEIDFGIPSSTGPWLMRELIGLAKSIELTLTGQLVDAEEACRIGLITKIVARERVLDEAVAIAGFLASKPPVAMRLTKQRFREATEANFRDAISAGARIQAEAYASGEPAQMMAQFLDRRAAARSDVR